MISDIKENFQGYISTTSQNEVQGPYTHNMSQCEILGVGAKIIGLLRHVNHKEKGPLANELESTCEFCM